MRAAGVPCRARIRETHAGRRDRIPRPATGSPRTSPRSRSGSRRSDRRRTRSRVAAARARAADAIASARGVPPLHALQDEIVARLQREMEMRHEPRLVASSAQQLVVRPRSGRARRAAGAAARAPAPAAARTICPRLGAPGQIGAVGGEIDAGQHDLAVPASTSARACADDPPERHRAGWRRGHRE